MSEDDSTDAAGSEFDRIPASFRAAARRQLVEDEVTIAILGDRTALAADRDALCLITEARVGPVARRIRFNEVATVDAAMRDGRAVLYFMLRDGAAISFDVPPEGAEAGMQAATILNLLVVDARRREPVGRGIAAQRSQWRDRVRPSGRR